MESSFFLLLSREACFWDYHCRYSRTATCRVGAPTAKDRELRSLALEDRPQALGCLTLRRVCQSYGNHFSRGQDTKSTNGA